MKWIVKPCLINLNRKVAVCRVSLKQGVCQANTYKPLLPVIPRRRESMHFQALGLVNAR